MYEDYDDLLAEVKSDLDEFGSDLQVIAIYSIFLDNPDRYVITSYIWGDVIKDSDTDIYLQECRIHEKELATLEYTKHDKMTIRQLYNKLLEQKY